MWNPKKTKKDTNELIDTTESDPENKFIVTKGERGGRDKLGAWDLHICTIIYKIDDHQGPTV